MLSNGEKIAEENVTKLSVKMWVEGRTMHDFWVEIKKICELLSPIQSRNVLIWL